MQLGWSRVSDEHTSRLSVPDLRDAIAQSDALGFRQIHIAKPAEIATLPRTENLHIGLNLADLAQQPPRTLAKTVLAAWESQEGRLVIGLTQGRSPSDCTAFQTFETLFADAKRRPFNSDFPLSQPRPEVLVTPRAGTAPDVVRAAGNGFHALSPAWQSRSNLARHWPDIVAGATHSARRVCPSQWHVARCVFVSDDRAAVAAYNAGPALAYLQRSGIVGSDMKALASELIIAGSAQHVAERLINLRTRIGPFGTLHCVDPGLDPKDAACQRKRIAFDVLPALRGQTIAPKKELVRI